MTWGLHGLALLPMSPQHCHSLGNTKWVPPTEYSFSMIPPTFRSLHLSWAHHYWALNGGFLETSSKYLTPRPVEPGKFATPLNICFRAMDNFGVRPRKAYHLRARKYRCDWSHSHTHGVSQRWSPDRLHAKEEVAVGVFKKPIFWLSTYQSKMESLVSALEWLCSPISNKNIKET